MLQTTNDEKESVKETCENLIIINLRLAKDENVLQNALLCLFVRMMELNRNELGKA